MLIFQDIFETHKFISAFSTCMTVPLKAVLRFLRRYIFLEIVSIKVARVVNLKSVFTD